MAAYIILTVVVPVVLAICKLTFGLVALRGVPHSKRADVVRAIGDDWSHWGVNVGGIFQRLRGGGG